MNEMKKLPFLFILFFQSALLQAQNRSDTTKIVQTPKNADDPSQFFTRVEIFNELQRYDKTDIYLNQTILRTIVKLGKRFTTRLDIPYVYNSFTSSANYRQSGIGDISFRLLGFRFLERPKSALTISMEVSLNTAQSPLLGLGKTLLIPVVSYSKLIPKEKIILALVLQQTNSISGDEERSKVSFTKIQATMLKYWSRRTWTVLSPEWFVDYVRGGVSMNLRTRLTHAPIPRMNIWITPSAGIFGDFPGRYTWSLDVGGRFFLLREMKFKKKKNGE